MNPREVLQSCDLSYCLFILSYNSKSEHGLKYLKHTDSMQELKIQLHCTCSPIYHLWVLRFAVQGNGRATSMALNLCIPSFSVLIHALHTGILINQWGSFCRRRVMSLPSYLIFIFQQYSHYKTFGSTCI
jgi:hypothetical protein